MSAGLRVLAFADVRSSLVAAARVFGPLRALRDAGHVSSYTVTDATLRGAPRRGHYDVVWLQRAADPWLAHALASRLRGRYLLDVDDHLLCRPAYLRPEELPQADTVIAALDGCRVLVTPSERLTRLLEQRSGRSLEGRSHTCPNALQFDRLPLRHGPERPEALLLTQGHVTALLESREAFLTAVTDAAARHRLPIWAVGAQPRGLSAAAGDRGATLVSLRAQTWDDYHRKLAGPPAVVGLAPLETRGDAATLEFVAGKSDVKMVEFGGLGHSAVYSDAAPYTDTDLACGRVVPNDPASWAQALDEAVSSGSGVAAREEAAAVRELRDLRRVAADCWRPALEAARLEDPIDAALLFRRLDRARARTRDALARARWRLRHGR